MEKKEVQSLVHKAVLSVKSDLDSESLKEEASLTNDLGFDSMNLVALASELENLFEKSLPLSQWVSEEGEKGLKLSSLVDFLTTTLNQKKDS
jgi:acyl carrier protein